MKRSEMIKVLSVAISDMTNLSMNIRELDYILRQIERRGMLPPLRQGEDEFDRFCNIDDNGWDEE